MAKSGRVARLRAQWIELGKLIEIAAKQEFQIGARVRWTSHGVDNRIGRVEDYGGFNADTRLRVRTERTNKLVDVPLYLNPEVLA